VRRTWDLGSKAKSRRKEITKCGEHAGMGAIPERIASGKRAYRQLQADHGTDPRRDKHVEPRSQAAFDAAELRPGDRDGSSDFGERQAGGDSGSTYLVAEGEKEPAAAARPAGGVRFGHPRIVTLGAYRPINRAATIQP
jgi:hypothetical protein